MYMTNINVYGGREGGREGGRGGRHSLLGVDLKVNDDWFILVVGHLAVDRLLLLHDDVDVAGDEL